MVEHMETSDNVISDSDTNTNDHITNDCSDMIIICFCMRVFV